MMDSTINGDLVHGIGRSPSASPISLTVAENSEPAGLRSGPDEASLSAIFQALQVQREEAQEYYTQARADSSLIKQSLTEVKGKVAALASDITELQQRVADTEDYVTKSAKTLEVQDNQLKLLQGKIEDLENRQRRNNLQLFGVPEGEEGMDPRGYIV